MAIPWAVRRLCPRWAWTTVPFLLLGVASLSGQSQASPHGPLPPGTDCAACHTPDEWAPAKVVLDFEHGTTAFPLTGSHVDAACTGCHLDLDFGQPQVQPRDCITCHLDVHQTALSNECASCHSTVSFQDLPAVELHTRTQFPLTGAHLQISCESCHTNDARGAFAPVDVDCLSCHQEDYGSTAIIDHQALGFPTTCERCHGTLDWSAAEDFDHGALSNGFDLLGAHVRAECASCHVVPSLEPLFTANGAEDCVACHQASYDSEHLGTGFPPECLNCHTVETWEGATFDHLQISEGFPLLGRHAEVECSTCHTPPNNALIFNTTDANDCVACHQTDYDTEHAASGFPTDCLSCHTVDGWEGASFEHESSTGFPLLGRHLQIDCVTCHSAPGFAVPFNAQDANDCVACHQADYDGEHAGTGFSTDCTDCHTADSWDASDVDHAIVANGFELTGAHLAIDCEQCHSLPDNAVPWSPTSDADCVACHRADYDLEHAGTGFSTTCTNCHTDTSWQGANFDHATAANGFQLVGAHAQKACTTCHTNADGTTPWTGVPQDNCIACHQSDYTSQHAGTGFPNDCLSCHTQDTWKGATFDHASAANGFQLVGAHAQKACATCHTNPDGTTPWTGVPQDNCIACHQTDYTSQHAGTGFPNNCLACHNQNTWTGATFNHDGLWFPIYSGKHKPESWNNQCTSCHADPTNFKVFSCLNCHKHRQPEMDNKHSEVNGYAYNSDQCLICHPTGN